MRLEGPWKGFVPGVPMIVVGALRSGGSGKTSVTLELARAFVGRGLKVAILAYRMGPGPLGRGGDLIEVAAGDDWRPVSEEAVMLRRDSGARVFVTRDRSAARRRLEDPEVHGGAPFDLILSDDGFQDPRLRGALRLLLTAPGERPGLFDLLPGGPFRETWRSAARADMILEGPHPAPVTSREPIRPVPPDERSAAPAAWAAGARASASRPVHRFHRGLVFPPGFDKAGPWIALCALGDNGPFLRDLSREGIRPVAVVEGRNHGPLPVRSLAACRKRHPGAGVLCTRKELLRSEAPAELCPVGQAVFLDPGILAAAEAYLLRFRKGYLVH